MEWVLSSWLSKMVSEGSEHNRKLISLVRAVDSKQMSSTVALTGVAECLTQ